MAAKNAVVRSLPSVETLGSCSVICSDKTGTLTTNQMSVSKMVFLNESGTGLEEIDVQGTTYSPVGGILSGGKYLNDLASSSPTVLKMTEVAALCNGSQLSFDPKNQTYSNVGEPTEGALRVLVEKIGTPEPAVNQAARELPVHQRLQHASKYFEEKNPLLATYEFSRDRKSMSVLVDSTTKKRLLVKGAPESILERCTHALIGFNGKRVSLNEKLSRLISQEVVEYGNRGLRVIALANVEDVGSNPLLSSAKTTEEYSRLEANMTLIGLVGMLDPPRPEVAESVMKCKEAGIRVVVITGDNQNTAETICRQIGVFGGHENLKGKSYTGKEFDTFKSRRKAPGCQDSATFPSNRTQP